MSHLLHASASYAHDWWVQTGYARVSTDEQTLHLRKDAMNPANCGHTFTGTAGAAGAERPGLATALEQLRDGDTLGVWRLERLGRSLRHRIHTQAELHKRGIGFR